MASLLQLVRDFTVRAGTDLDDDWAAERAAHPHWILPAAESDDGLHVFFRFGGKAQHVPVDAELTKWSETEPIILLEHSDGRVHWFYQRRVYLAADDGLTPADVIALVNEAENARRLRLEKAHALQAMREQTDTLAKRQPIPQDVKIAVWQRDHGRCVECQRNEELEFDHIIPLAMGGSNTMRNLQLLCADCNRRKGATLG